MNKLHLLAAIILSIALLSIQSACMTELSSYGKRNLRIHNDSLATFQKKKALNGLSDDDFHFSSFQAQNGINIPYRLLNPISKKLTVKYPLVITFHNSSRIGTDNKSQLEPLARIWLQNDIRKKYQAYVLAPQFSERSTVYSTDQKRSILTSKAQPQLLAILPLIDTLIQKYNIDEKRIYLVGYSMGGSSAINLLNLKPEKFAAVVAIAGVPQFEHVIKIQKNPLWLIHGSADDENPFSGSESFYQEIKSGHQSRLWVFKNKNHNNIVSSKLLGNVIPKWLFSKKKR